MKTILKVVVGIGFIGQGLWAMGPGAPILITDQMNGEVIEVENGVVLGTWSFTGLGSPTEAIPLTNGNWIIADSGNGRIIEVNPANKTVVKEWTGYQDGSVNFPFIFPRDVRRCVWYDGGIGTDTLLVVDGTGTSGLDGYGERIVEILYNQEGYSEAKMVDSNAMGVREAEKRPGKGTLTYLIACNNGVRECSETFPGVWQWNWLSYDNSRDAEWLPCGSILVVRGGDYNDVVEIKGDGSRQVIATWTFSGFIPNFYPHEATLIEDGNIIIAGATGTVPSNDGYILRGTRTTEGGSWVLTPADAIYSKQTARFFDVEEKGIINIAKIVYANSHGEGTKTILAGVVVPILQPTIIGPPYIVATKIGTPTGPLGPGDIVTYIITLKNTGSGTATNVVVIDQIPPGTEFVVYSDNPPASSYSEDGGATWILGTPVTGAKPTHLRWTYNQIGPGETCTINFSVKIKE